MSQLKGGTFKKERITAVAETEAANKSYASLSLTVGANCSVQTVLHLHTATATGVACIRKWNICDVIHLLCLTWVLVMPSGTCRTVLFNSLCCLLNFLHILNLPTQKAQPKLSFLWSTSLRQGLKNYESLINLAVKSPIHWTMCFVYVGDQMKVLVLFFNGNRIHVQDFTHILQSINHNWDNNVRRWYNQWE